MKAKIFISIILVIAISLFTLSLGIELYSFSLKEYMNNYEENNLAEITNKTFEEYENISKDIIKYLKGADIGLMEGHFNQREVLHMKDVQDLFKLNRIIKCLSLVLIIILIFIIRNDYNTLTLTIKALNINYIFLALLVLATKIDFGKYFTYFHLIFFNNDLWLLDPKTDLLIQMMPEIFFLKMAIKIGISFGIMILLSQGVLLGIRKRI